MEEQMIGKAGYLMDLGLIPLPDAERTQARKQVAGHEALTLADLK